MAGLVDQIFKQSQLAAGIGTGLGNFFTAGVGSQQQDRQLDISEERSRLLADQVRMEGVRTKIAYEKHRTMQENNRIEEQNEVELASIISRINGSPDGWKRSNPLVGEGMSLLGRIPSNSNLASIFMEQFQNQIGLDEIERRTGLAKERAREFGFEAYSVGADGGISYRKAEPEPASIQAFKYHVGQLASSDPDVRRASRAALNLDRLTEEDSIRADILERQLIELTKASVSSDPMVDQERVKEQYEKAEKALFDLTQRKNVSNVTTSPSASDPLGLGLTR